MEKAVWKAAVNRKVNNCVYNWTSDRKTGRFATANEVKSVTSHEVINKIGGRGFLLFRKKRDSGEHFMQLVFIKRKVLCNRKAYHIRISYYEL